jgi:hypothetical protein
METTLDSLFWPMTAAAGLAFTAWAVWRESLRKGR